MTYISTPNAPDGERWFHTIDQIAEQEGIWHLGKAPAGKTWPVERARCGYTQLDPAIGDQATSLSIGTAVENICDICLSSLRAELELARRI